VAGLRPPGSVAAIGVWSSRLVGEVRVGTSGWQYDDWRGAVYPEDLPKKRWLEHYATRFPTVEVNSTFYRLARTSAVEQWREAAPAGFEFVLKGSRFITHQKKLKDPREPLERFFEPLGGVLDRTAAILWQLPGGWRRNVDRLDAFLAALPTGHRHAVEFRGDDWFHDETYGVLDRHGVANVWLSSSLTVEHAVVTTGDHVYLRLHGLDQDEPYRYDYSAEELEPWAERLREVAGAGTPAWVFFNNDHAGHAVHNAEVLIDLLGDAARRWPPEG
jgi:uncharacterized protein YecE (DUF72 family)